MMYHDVIRPLDLRSVSYSFDTPHVFLQDCRGEYLAYHECQPSRPVVKIEAEGWSRRGDIVALEIGRDGLADDCKTYDEYSMRAELIGLPRSDIMTEAYFVTYKTLRRVADEMKKFAAK